MARIDYDRAAVTYDSGRDMAADELEPWRLAIARRLPGGTGLCLVDVGAGTGISTAALTRWFGALVVGVEPSDGMRSRAAAKGVHLVGGTAERLPLRDGSCDGAWLSTVIHHVTDLPAVAQELRRVLRAGAPVLVRSSFPGRHDEIPLFRWFPAAGREASTFPTVDETVAAFAERGFGFEALERVRTVVAPDPAAARDRVIAMRDADSTLAPLSDEEFRAGLAAIDEEPAGPVISGVDLLVLR